MIQRIQSIYLLLSAVCVFLCYVFPFAQIDEVKTTYTFHVNGIIIDGKNILNIPYNIIIPTLASAGFLNIFLFKKRKIQIRINQLNYILHIILLLLIFFSVQHAINFTLLPDAAKVSYGLGFFLLTASIAFLLLANRAIKRDDELIKSIDRLRG